MDIKKNDVKKMALMIDHTILKASATKEQIIKYCNEAKKYDFASVCVNPYNVKLVSEQLKGTRIKVCTVIGFPLGANTIEVKEFEAKNAIDNGAHEIDMVINIGALKDCDYEYVEREISLVVSLAKINKVLVKVIIETCFLTDKEKEIASKLCEKAGANFVKTSTGFGTEGAVVLDIMLIKNNIEAKTNIKASGSIKNLKSALQMIEAGATRIGTSVGTTIIEELKNT